MRRSSPKTINKSLLLRALEDERGICFPYTPAIEASCKGLIRFESHSLLVGIQWADKQTIKSPEDLLIP